MANAHDLLMAQRAAMMGGKSLPYMRRVAYLKSTTRTEYLLFNDLKHPNIDVYILPESVRSSGGYGVGRWNGASRADGISYQYYNYRGYTVTNGNSAGNINSGNTDRSSLMHVVVSGRNVTIGGAPFTMGASWGDYGYGFYSFALFGCATDTGVTCFQTSIGECKLYDGTNLRYDLKPVLDLSGRPAMYDELSGQLFHNQGSGEFDWVELET